MKVTNRPQSTNIVDIRPSPSRKKLGNDDVGQRKGKLETWLDKNQPTSSTPSRSRKKSTKNINKNGRGSRKKSTGRLTGGGF